jgi:D-alanine-D-alanine ligase
MIRVAVLFGGPSGEHEVSCASAASILEHLDRDRFEVTSILVTRDGEWLVNGENTPSINHLARAIDVLGRVDVVLPAFHGRFGEDGTVQALLELIGVPYVGNGLASSAVGMDKEWTKILLRAAGLRVAEGVTLHPGEVFSIEDRNRLGLPVFVKPAREGSSLGVTRVNDWAALDEALATARLRDTKVLVEEAVPGREVDVAVLQRPDGSLVCGPPLEIKVGPAGEFFDFDAKYQADAGTVFDIPARLDPALTELVQDQARQAFRALGCRGLLRVDFFLRPTDSGSVLEPVINEVNTFPGFTSRSQYPLIWQAAGVSYPELLSSLIETALAGRVSVSPAAA